MRLDSLSDLLSSPLKEKATGQAVVSGRDQIFINRIHSKITSGSSVSLEPLARNQTIQSDYLTDSLKKLNGQSTGEYEPFIGSKTNLTSAGRNKANRSSRSLKPKKVCITYNDL